MLQFRGQKLSRAAIHHSLIPQPQRMGTKADAWQQNLVFSSLAWSKGPFKYKNLLQWKEMKLLLTRCFQSPVNERHPWFTSLDSLCKGSRLKNRVNEEWIQRFTPESKFLGLYILIKKWQQRNTPTWKKTVSKKRFTNT